MLLFPKLGFDNAPSSDSCGMRSLLESLQGRVAVLTDVRNGLTSFMMLTLCSSATYRPTVALTAVRPLPNRSYDAPIRGLMSFQFGTSGTFANVLGPTHRPPGADCSLISQFR